MPKINSKDLTLLAIQPSENYTKEGLLWFKEKEGKIFGKSENVTERLIRLRGNLLFYFKGKDKSTELAGVIVLERCNIIPDTSGHRYGFTLSFDATDEQKYEFLANTKSECDKWVDLIQRSSYEKLRMRLLGLRQQIQTITGQDPLPDYHVAPVDKELLRNRKRVSLFASNIEELDHRREEVLMEMCIACTQLSTASETIPSIMVVVYTVQPPQTEWNKHSQTEISDETLEPSFLRTIVFSSSFSPMTRLKFIVYNVLNKSKNDTKQIGLAYCTLQEIQLSPSWHVTLSIMNMDSQVGNIIIQGWKREVRNSIIGRTKSFSMSDDCKDGGLLEPPINFITKPIQRSFHFPTEDGKDWKFQTFTAESTLCFKIPKLLLSMFIDEEKNGVIELHNIGELHPDWERHKQLVQNNHFDIVHQYSTNYADLCQFEDQFFKRSVDKASKELEFIPTNLHMERLCVVENDHEFMYDFVTVGAPTAHSLRFRNGGLKRNIDEKMKKLNSQNSEEKRRSGLSDASLFKSELRLLKNEIWKIVKEVQELFENNNDISQMNDVSTTLTMKVGDLLSLQSSDFICECEQQLLKARSVGPELRIRSTIISNELERTRSVWVWSGSEFKDDVSLDKGADCGVMDALANFTSKVNSLSEGKFKKEELVSDITNLENYLKSLLAKLNTVLRFKLLRDNLESSVGLKDIQHRRDVVFSQALTPIVAGFSLMLSQRVHDNKFLQQLDKLGFLIHFESLLTTYGDEMGMIEDMYVGLEDVRTTVRFRLRKSDTDETPVIEGTRSEMIVTFFLKSRLFKLLPKRLQNDGLIDLCLVVFIMGINDFATLAENFGDTSLQDHINHENLERLQNYFSKFNELFPNHVGTRTSSPVPLQKLMQNLANTVNMKKSKNFEILLQSEEICWRLNAMRMTSCKSGKDRTSMSVTLEEKEILEREHNMKKSVSKQVLNSIRSQGTRLINCYKNVGLAKYAFNKVQVRALPEPYRPPDGTTGKCVQT